MHSKKLYILLADNDMDDCYFIWEVLKERSLTTHLTNVLDEEELMELLTTKTTELPALLFPDLNMTRKNRFECLSTIRCNEKIKHPVKTIFSCNAQTNQWCGNIGYPISDGIQCSILALSFS